MSPVVSLSSYHYAAGAWALRLTGQASSLSALAERVVLRRLRFDLRLEEEDCHGDVDTAALARSRETGLSRTGISPIFELSGPGSDLADLTQMVRDYVQQYLEEDGLAPSQGVSQGTMTLTPVGLTRHRFTVVMAGQTAAVNLSLLQLADLAAVLAEAEQSVDWLPEAMVASPQQRSRPRRPLWAGSVAAVLVAAVLGSQWLGQAPPARMPSPTPTAERLRTSDDRAAGGGAQREVLAEDLPLEGRPGGLPPGDIAADGATTAGTNASEPSAPGAGLPTVPQPPIPPPRPAAGSGVARDVDPRPVPSGVPTVPPSLPARLPEGGMAPAPSANASPTAPSPSAERQTPRSAPLIDSALAPAAAPFETAPTDTATLEAEGGELGTGADALEAVRVALALTWQPIPGLASPLRYRLTLAPTGIVLAVEPLTAPSRPYLSRGTLPQVGAVLPQVRLSAPLTVDIDLLPSGEVRVSPSRDVQP